MILLLLYRGLCIDATVYYQEMIAFADKNLHAISTFEDPAPTTKYGLMAVYSGDESDDNGYVQGICVLGYTLMKMMPDFDRILVVNAKAAKIADHVSNFKKAWTHIIYRAPIDWPENITTTSVDKYLFKLQGWTVTGWEKLIFLGADVIVLASLDYMFGWPTPSVAANMYNLTMSKSVLDINMDLLGITPSYADYLGLLRTSVSYLKKQPVLDNWDKLGSIISEHFNTRLHVLPFAMIGENGGDVRTFLGNPFLRRFEIAAKSVHYGGNAKPWSSRRRQSTYTDAWISLASYTFQKLALPFKRPSQLSSPKKRTNTQVLNVFLTRSKYMSERKKTRMDEEAKEDTIDVYSGVPQIGLKSVLRVTFLGIFVTALILRYIFSKSDTLNSFVMKMGTRIGQFVKLDESSLYESENRDTV